MIAGRNETGAAPASVTPSQGPWPATATRPVGLATSEVEQRVAQGLVNDAASPPTRSTRQIIVGNLRTPFNLILGSLLVVTLIIGPIQDAAFGVVLVCNLLIGTAEELRAKRSLDRIVLLTAPSTRVVRDGREIAVDARAVVQDDLMIVGSGDQVVADGEVLTSDGLEVNEALVSGESEPVHKPDGSALVAGSFAVAGRGLVRATRVGRAAYGQLLTAEAREWHRIHSEVMSVTNTLLRVIALLLIPVGVFTVVTQQRINATTIDTIRASVAGLVTLIPQGLVLLTSVAFAMAVIRLARHRVLVSELAGVEPLARVDTVCIDKTGTLTTGRLTLLGIEWLGADPGAAPAVRALAAAEDDANMIAAALRASMVDVETIAVVRHVPFSSARRWSGVTVAAGDSWILGAPEVVGSSEPGPPWSDRVRAHLGDGERVVLLARSPGSLDGGLPADRTVIAILRFAEEIRQGVAASLAYLRDQGVTVRVLSGDNPVTAWHVAQRAGAEPAGAPLDASAFTDDDALGMAACETSVVGRIGPRQKLAVVHALKRSGHTVAMAGDGVNDVLALRGADLGIAMGSGAAATRGVAHLVLLDGTLEALPLIVAEGRRVLANIERVAALFLSKTVFALVLVLVAAWAALPYPLLLRHLAAVDFVAIGVPSFVLAIPANRRPWRPGFLRRTLRLSVPAGIVIGAASAGIYVISVMDLGESLAVGHSLAAYVLAACGFWLITIVAREHLLLGRVLAATMAGIFVLVVAAPASRGFFSFALPGPAAAVVACAVACLAVLLLEAVGRLTRRRAVRD